MRAIVSLGVAVTGALPLEVKGSIVRSLVAAIAAHGHTAAVSARVSPAARALLTEPPLPTMWVDGRLSLELYQAVYETAGADQLRRISREAIERGVLPLLRSIIERVLAIFGTSPATLLSRLDRAAAGTTRGLVYRYEPIDETSGRFEIEYPSLTDVPIGPFVATGGALELIFEMCGTRGVFSDPEMVPNGRRNRMRYAVSWRTVTRR
jgi:hypothetical protein